MCELSWTFLLQLFFSEFGNHSKVYLYRINSSTKFNHVKPLFVLLLLFVILNPPSCTYVDTLVKSFVCISVQNS